MTHPFHPLYGRDFEFAATARTGARNRVHLHDENGQLLLTASSVERTDAVAADPFVVVAPGRAPFSTGSPAGTR